MTCQGVKCLSTSRPKINDFNQPTEAVVIHRTFRDRCAEL